jgi:hypothetical protein
MILRKNPGEPFKFEVDTQEMKTTSAGLKLFPSAEGTEYFRSQAIYCQGDTKHILLRLHEQKMGGELVAV